LTRVLGGRGSGDGKSTVCVCVCAMRSLECSWRLTRREREKYYHNETLGKANYPHMRLFLTCSLQLGAHKGKHATGPEILNSNSIYTEHRGSSTTACNSRSYSCLEITTGRLSGTPAMCARTCSPAVCHWTSRRRIRASSPPPPMHTLPAASAASTALGRSRYGRVTLQALLLQ
jgi:hypothetical protein